MSLLTVGKGAVGTQPVAGSVYHDPPTVALTGPVSPLVGGDANAPVFKFTWDYAQPQGDPQEQYRLYVYDTGTMATYYDSGWLTSANAFHDVDIDAEGMPHVLTTYGATVEVRSWDARWEVVSAPWTWTVDWGNPHCDVTAPLPGQVLTTEDPLTVTWTFSDDLGGAVQEQYRVRILSKETLQPLYTTGWLTGTDASTVVPFSWADNSSYLVEVQLKNDNGIRSD